MTYKVASTFAIVLLVNICAVAAQSKQSIKLSESKQLTYEDVNYGSLKFTYYTYQDGELGLPLSYLYGKIEIEDGNFPKVGPCDQSKIDWSVDPPYCPHPIEWHKTEWKTENQLRVAMEFGEAENDGHKNQRAQIRLIRHLYDDHWDKTVQSVKDFNVWDRDNSKLEKYKFITIPEDDEAIIDRSGKNGIKIIAGTLDQENRKAMVEFVRPFDVSVDGALTLQGGQKYQLWLQWGIFDNKNDDNQLKVKGMRTFVDKKDFTDHPGVLWEIQAPPPAPPAPPKSSDSDSHALNLMAHALYSSLLIMLTIYSGL